MTISARDRLVLALDVPTEDKALELVELLSDEVLFYKIGLELFTATGFSVVDRLIEQSKKVFLDIKWFDIPETVGAVVRIASDRKVSFATVDGNGDGVMMRAAVKARRGELKLLCLTVLTSLNSHALQEMGKDATIEKLVKKRTSMAGDAEMNGVVASGQEVKFIRETAEAEGRKDFLIVTPGMRFRGTSGDDHRRACDPESAIKDGADYIVVGRPIRCADNPKDEAKRFVEAIDRGLSARSSIANSI